MKKLLNSFLFIFTIYLSAIAIFSLFRALLFLYCKTPDLMMTKSFLLFTQSFFMGLRFDTLVSCAILLIPLIVVLFTSFFKFSQKKYFTGVQIWSSILFTITFFFSAANIPYFSNFKKTINASIFNWIDEPDFVLGMIVGDLSFFLCLLAVIFISCGFCYWIFRLKKFFAKRADILQMSHSIKNYILSICFCVGIITLCVLGVRGRLASSPMRIGTAFFCSVSFLNEVALNPAFVVLKTALDTLKEHNKGINFMKLEDAEKIVRHYLNTQNNQNQSPIFRAVSGNLNAKKKNVVLVLMEGMSYDFLERKKYTPNLNALTEKSLSFSNAFSAGIHTVNGVYASSFGFPALLTQHPFKVTKGFVKYNGLANILKNQGYSTYFITSQDDQFDNIGGYLRATGTEKIISYNDYPREKILSKLGPPDDYAMRFSIPILTKDFKKTGKPFFAFYMMTCNHAPRIIPDYFKPRSLDEVEQTVELTDYAIGVFLEKASQETWFKDTIFIFTGDHGMVHYGSKYEDPIPYHHIPLIFYTPDNEIKNLNKNVAGQIDILATIMGLLNLPYQNETFGIDLTKTKRPYIFYSSDYTIATLDEEYLYFRQLLTQKEFLYRWKDDGKENLINTESTRAKTMRNYVEAMLQVAQSELENRH